MFPYYKCSKCLVRHLKRPPTSPRNLFKFPFEMDTFWDWFSCCWPLEGRRPCVSNTVTNLSIAFALFCKCFKCLFRHLVGRPPTSPRNVFNCPFWKYNWSIISDMFFFAVGHSKDRVYLGSGPSAVVARRPPRSKICWIYTKETSCLQ